MNLSCLNMNTLKTGKDSLINALFFFLGLRHVSDDQKTHKNPSLRAQCPPVRSPTKSHTPSPTSPKNSPQQSHTPVLELEGKKWRVVSSSHTSKLHPAYCKPGWALNILQKGCPWPGCDHSKMRWFLHCSALLQFSFYCSVASKVNSFVSENHTDSAGECQNEHVDSLQNQTIPQKQVQWRKLQLKFLLASHSCEREQCYHRALPPALLTNGITHLFFITMQACLPCFKSRAVFSFCSIYRWKR